MNDAREAAERILAGKEADCYLMSDARTLARAYLALVPADSDVAIDEVWLEAVLDPSWDHGHLSKRCCIGKPPLWYYPPCGNLRAFWQFGKPSGVGDMVQWCNLDNEPATRGDVRQLCAALGIQLKETN